VTNEEKFSFLVYTDTDTDVVMIINIQLILKVKYVQGKAEEVPRGYQEGAHRLED
jgi:hypothetical protein